MDTLLILTFINVVILGGFEVYRTYINHKSLKIQKILLTESRKYWASWKERSKDVAEKVLSEIPITDLRAELRRRQRRRRRVCRSRTNHVSKENQVPTK